MKDVCRLRERITIALTFDAFAGTTAQYYAALFRAARGVVGALADLEQPLVLPSPAASKSVKKYLIDTI